MELATKFIHNVFNKDLSGGYAVTFILFLLFCLGFIIWAIYYATVKRAVVELGRVSWLSLSDTLKYTGITVFSIVVFSGILFAYDFGLDKILNVIIKNAK